MLRNRPPLRRLLTVLSLDIFVKASAVVLLPVYLRLMTQEEYGLFNYILSIIYAVAMLLNLGLYIPQSKLFHDYPGSLERGKLITSIHILLTAGLLILVLPVYLFGLDNAIPRLLFRNPIHYDRYRPWILLMLLTSIFSYLLTNFFYTAERIEPIRRYSLWRVAGIHGVSILTMCLFQNGDPIRIRLAAIGCTELVLLVVFYRSYIGQAVKSIEPALLVRCLRLALPVMLGSLFGIIINFGDKFFLEKHADYKVLSVYYLGVACAGVVALLSTSLQNVWLPMFFKERDLSANLIKTDRLVSRLVRTLVLLSLVAIAAVAAGLQLSLIPQRYTGVLFVLPILLAGQVIYCVALLYSNYLVYFERTAFILWTGLAVAITSTGLNMLLIPVWKIYGAAATLLISNTCYLGIYYFLAMHYKKKHMP
ncbi:MAG TPA: oligosaccharide flippase family protein [Puia sp.]|nr:oligosaccharide flippase family protein [Puia sp.]